MDEMFEPRKKERLDKSFFKGFIFLFILGVFLVVGTSYSLEFFRANKNVGTINLRLGAISVSVTGDNTVNTTLTKQSDSDGITNGLVKTLTITNNNTILANYILKLERTSGIELSNIKYCLMINNVIQKVDTVPSDGVLFNNIILGNETLNAKVTLWIDNNYTGSDLTFNGTISSEIKRTYNLSSDVLEDVIDFDNITTSTNNYVSFNNETYRIVKIEDDRLVICKNADFDSTVSSRVNSNKFNTSLSYTDNSIIYSHSTDNKNLYLVKTVNIKSGKGTSSDPFILENNREYAGDKKALAYITYKDGSTTLFTQPIYYNQTNYISYVKNDPDFIGWSTTNGGTTVDYELGDTISFTTNTNLYVISSYVTLTSGCYTIKGNIITNEGIITDYSDSSSCPKNVSIPSTLEGYTIKEIGDSAFYQKGLTGVTISNTITKIGNASFGNCNSESCNEIMSNKLTTITIPNSVVSIGDFAFADNKLTSVNLGNGVQTIGESAFANNIGNGSAIIFDDGWGDELNWTDDNQITSITIPNSVSSLGDKAFSGNPITTINFGTGLTHLGAYSFGGQNVYDNNISIPSITLPSGLNHIYENFLYYNIGTITINDDYDIGLLFDSVYSNVNNFVINGDATYEGFMNGTITNLYLNSDGIHFWFNEEDDNITNIYIDNMIEIPEGYLGNIHCENIYIGNNVQIVNPFMIAYDGGHPDLVTSVSIGNNVTTIGYRAFQDFTNVTALTIPNSVTTIEGLAFGNMSSLTSISLGNGLTSIGTNAFYGCSSLTSLTIPNSVTTVGEGILASSGVSNLTIGTGLSTVGDNAFVTDYLSNVTINSNTLNWAQTTSTSGFVTSPFVFSTPKYDSLSLTINNSSIIPESAFSSMNISQVTFPSTLTTIGASAFFDNKLSNINIPDSVTTIGASAFAQNNLTSITIGSGINSIFWNTFVGNSNISTIKINKSCSDIHNMEDNTSWFSNGVDNYTNVTIYGANNVTCYSGGAWQ